MYHTQKINQAPIEKNLQRTGFSSQNLQTADYTPFERDILSIFKKYVNAPWIKLTNAFIAQQVGCSTRTVTRATSNFHKQGVITKHQPDDYRANHYTLSDVIKTSHRSPQSYISHSVKVDHKNKKVCIDVYPNKSSSLLLDSLLRKPVPVLTRVRARQNRKMFFIKIKGKIVNSVQKQLILSHRSDPTLKDIIRKPQVMSEIINPTLEKISQLLALDEKEQFKLVAFDENALEHVLAEVEPLVTGEKSIRTTIRNRMGWLIAIANDYCKKNNLIPDWAWYYGLCEILGIGTETQQKPLKTPKIKRPSTQLSDRLGQWQLIQQLTLIPRVEKWRSEVKSLQDKLDNFGPDPFHLKGLIVRSIENAKQELADAEKALKESDEKQDISYSRTTYSLEAYGA
jgi:hypothetical protein